jgi:hypothetical protein
MKTLLTIVVLVLLAGTASAQSPDLWGFNPQTQEHDKYLGNLNQNPYDPNSVNNPYGQYGSKYSPDSIRNPYGTYGSPYSPYSPTNPYAKRQQVAVDFREVICVIPVRSG